MPNGTSTKTCRKCGTEKPAAEFHKRAASTDGLHSYCKVCNQVTAVAGKRKLHREIPGRKPRQPWRVGDVFGELTVIGITQPKGHVKLLECQCSCGQRRAIWCNGVATTAYWDCGDGTAHYRPPTTAEREREQRRANGDLIELSKTPCPDCGGQMSKDAKTCKPCSYKRHQIRAANDPRVKRWQRDKAAPGLKQHERTRLLRKWQSQHRMCIYCGVRPANTVDHVIPLVRGGDSNEGNLAPCCHPCNSMKGGRMVAEWKLNVQLARQIKPAVWQWRPKPKPMPKVKRIKPIVGEQSHMFKVCPACGVGYFGNAAYCSTKCHMRSAYRLKVGIPVTAPRWTRKSA